MIVCERKFISKGGIKLINKRIKMEREKLGLTQKELADRLAVSPGAVGMYEQGRRIPEVFIIEKMADLFDCSVDYLLGRTNNKGEILRAPNFDEALVVLAEKANVDVKQIKEYIQYLKFRRDNRD